MDLSHELASLYEIIELGQNACAYSTDLDLGPSWMDPIMESPQEGALPSDKRETH